MAIMDMAMVRSAKSTSVFLITTLFGSGVSAAESEFSLSTSLTETYSDNVLLSTFEQDDSYITNATINLSSSVSSKALNMNLNSSYSHLFYSHDSELNKGYESLSTSGQFAPWFSGPALSFSGTIANAPRSIAGNSQSDLISGDTIKTTSYGVGLVQNVVNSDFNLGASINYSDNSAEDDVGESNGYQAGVSFSNGSSHRVLFWDISGSYSDRKNRGQSARSFQTEGKLGLQTAWKLNPFIRYFNEDYTGSISNNQNDQGESWGAGFRWQPKRNLLIDLSYNLVSDEELTDDYVDTNINWTPTSRTSIQAGYNQRFFGDSYSFNLTHRNKRLTNTISYNEQIQAFQRDSFETFIDSTIWCPLGQPIDVNNCLDSSDGVENIDEFAEVPLFGVRPVEDNQFSLYKTLSWNSTLALARTTFNLILSNSEREDLNTGNVQDFLSSNLSATRKMNSRSSVTLAWSFTRNNYTTVNGDLISEQRDYYRNYNLSYDRTIAESLSLDISIRYLDRASNFNRRSYEETRANIAIRKDF